MGKYILKKNRLWEIERRIREAEKELVGLRKEKDALQNEVKFYEDHYAE